MGYGDYYQTTNFGRILAVIACLLGSCLVSLMVVSIQDSLKLFPEEERVVEFLHRIKDRYKINQTSSCLVKATFDYIYFKNAFLKYVNSEDPNKSIDALNKIGVKLKDAVYRRVKYRKLFKRLLQ